LNFNNSMFCWMPVIMISVVIELIQTVQKVY
jgi:hypothetical protein